MVKEPAIEEQTQELAARLIDHVKVEIEVVLGEAQLSVSELSSLEQGAVLPVDRKMSEAADIRINGRVIARGEIVSVDDKFAVRVTQIGD